MDEKIYKVVDIISEFDIVINAGKEDNITIGDKFEIFAYGKKVTDPDTGETLGTLDIIKETVEVINIFPKICQCRKIVTVTKTYSPATVSKLLTEALTYPVTQTYPERLKVDYTAISPNIEVDITIKIGDKARLIT